jgi:dTDP-4-dehydrorhamnose reductase
MRVAVTGATGRLGSALVAALADAPFPGPGGPLAWDRSAFDLDAPGPVGERLDRDRPEVVVHAAAWTDVDGCARDPDLALQRNGVATGVLAAACAARGIDLVAISTNEVFDGRRTDGVGYAPTDPPSPANPYGHSKLAGERAATEAFATAAGPGSGSDRGGRLGIVRTAWLFGPPGRDFPRKILEAADRAAAAGEPLKVVGDEWGTPTFAADVADAIVLLLAEDAHAGIHHVVNGLFASRALWAEYLVGRFSLPVTVDHVPGTTWERASVPPRWGVLAATPLPSGELLRAWPDAMADYAPALERAWRRERVAP